MKCYGDYHRWGKAQLEGISPIHIAARVGCVELVRFIASYSENPNIAKADGWSPIHIAAFSFRISGIQSRKSKWT